MYSSVFVCFTNDNATNTLPYVHFLCDFVQWKVASRKYPNMATYHMCNTLCKKTIIIGVNCDNALEWLGFDQCVNSFN